MSVALLIERNGEENLSTPVATEAVFRRHWLPVCVELKLQWIPLFESGLPVSEQDRPWILDELQRFEMLVQQREPNSDIARRASTLADALHSINFNEGVSAYIG
ncbi:MAG: hypothetical protein ACPGTU_10820 [Myxococcota bacterium]